LGSYLPESCRIGKDCLHRLGTVPQATAPIWLGPVLSAVIPLAILTPFMIWMFVRWNRSPEGGVALRTRSNSWDVPGSPDEVLGRIIDRARDRRASVQDRYSDSAILGIGSQTTFRMWGFLTPRLSIPMRFRVAVHASGDSQTHVSVDAESDPGWYAFDSRLVDRIYKRAFDALFQMLFEASEVRVPSSA